MNRVRLVIIEGPDGSGKSTIADELVTRHGFTLSHHDVTPGLSVDLCDHYIQLVRRYLENSEVALVLDRCFVSELVYGPMFRGGSRISVVQAALALVSLSRSWPTRFLLTDGPPSLIMSAIRNRDPSDPSIKTVVETCKTYAKIGSELERYGQQVTRINVLSTVRSELPGLAKSIIRGPIDPR